MAKLRVLIIGKVDILSTVFDNRNYIVIISANYEEAIELLKKQSFDFVITDAEVRCKNNCLDLLRHIEKYCAVKPIMFVCSLRRVCRAEGRDWIIFPSLRAFYPFASYFEGTLAVCIQQTLEPELKRA